jgi:hypothetical protein
MNSQFELIAERDIDADLLCPLCRHQNEAEPDEPSLCDECRYRDYPKGRR